MVLALVVAAGCQPPPASSRAGTMRAETPARTAPSPPSSAPLQASAPAEESVRERPELPAFTHITNRAPERERTLERLVAFMADPALTVLAVAEIYGAVTPAEAFRNILPIADPLVDATKLAIHQTRVQNRRYVDAFEISFRREVAPTISDVVARLGKRPPRRAVRLEHHCSHGPCPRYTTTVRSGEVDIRATLDIDLQAPVFAGQILAPFEHAADPRKKRVRSLRLTLAKRSCKEGEPLQGAERITLQRATTKRERLVVEGVEAAARAMALDPIDETAVERALGVTMPRDEALPSRRLLPMGIEPQASTLGPHLRVYWSGMGATGHAEMDLFVEGQDFPPLALPGLRYVDEPERICRLYRDGEHLYELATPSPSAYRVVVSVYVGRDIDDDTPHLDGIAIRRLPPDATP